MYLYGLSLQIVTAGNGKDVLKLESTLTFFGYEKRYISFVATRNANNELASRSISNQTHLESGNTHLETMQLIAAKLLTGKQQNYALCCATTKTTTSAAVAKKADPTAYDVWYSCRTEPPKMPSLEYSSSRDYAPHGYSRHGNFGGSVFAVWVNIFITLLTSSSAVVIADRTAWSAKKIITAWFLFLTLFIVIASSRPVNKNVGTSAVIRAKIGRETGRS